jgi:hypothetical protein
MRRRGRRVVIGRLAQVLAIDERVVERATAHLAHDLGEIRVDGLVRE